MAMQFKDLSVKTKVTGAFALVLIATIALGLFAMGGLSSLDTDANDLRSNWLPSIKALGRFEMKITHYRAFQASMLLVDESQRVGDDKIRAGVRSDAEKAWADYQTHVTEGKERELANAVQQAWDAYRPMEEQELALLHSKGVSAAAYYYTHDMRTAFSTLKSAVDASVEFNSAAGVTAGERGHNTYLNGRLLILAVIALALALCAVAGFFLIRGVSEPLKNMTRAMGELARGNLDAHVPHADQRDEVGQLAEAMTGFKNQLAAAERSKAEQTETIVSSIGTGLDHLAKGNLAHRIASELTGPFGKLKNDFNVAMDNLQETMKGVLGTTEQIAVGAGEISQAADDLSRRTEQQAASLEETAAALEEITATVKSTAVNAKQARTSVKAARDTAEEGGKVVSSAILAMDAIANSSKQITDIIGVIDEIAFQTNLLALNAGVEAARAGEAGKGFAVVASEVRSLAQRSSEAAKQIKSLINMSGEHVGAGVKLVGESGEALKHIVAEVEQINGLVTEMARAAEQQSTGIEEVNAAVSQMDQVTQQNAAMVEESTAASRNLAGETQNLRGMVGFFNVGAVDQYTARREAAPQLAKSAGKPVARATRPVRKAQAVVAVNRSPKASEDDWTEF